MGKTGGGGRGGRGGAEGQPTGALGSELPISAGSLGINFERYYERGATRYQLVASRTVRGYGERVAYIIPTQRGTLQLRGGTQGRGGYTELLRRGTMDELDELVTEGAAFLRPEGAL